MKKFKEIATYYIERGNLPFQVLDIEARNELLEAWLAGRNEVDRDYAANMIIDSDENNMLGKLLMKILVRDELPEMLFHAVSGNIRNYLADVIERAYEEIRFNISNPTPFEIAEMKRDRLAEMINEQRRFN